MPSSVFAAAVMTSAYGRGPLPRPCPAPAPRPWTASAATGPERACNGASAEEPARNAIALLSARDHETRFRCRFMCMSSDVLANAAAAAAQCRRGARRRLGAWDLRIENRRDLFARVGEVPARVFVEPRRGDRGLELTAERVELALHQHPDLRACGRRAVDFLIHVLEIRALQIAAVDRDGRTRLGGFGPNAVPHVGQKLERRVRDRCTVDRQLLRHAIDALILQQARENRRL